MSNTCPQTAADLPTDPVEIIRYLHRRLIGECEFHAVITGDQKTCLGKWLEGVIATNQTGVSDEFLLARDLARDLRAAFLKSTKDLEIKGRGLVVVDALAALHDASTDAAMMAAIKRLHGACGAPGNYGYGTPIGDGLMKLYKIHDLIRKG